MVLSLINTVSEDGDEVCGYWLTDHVGTPESAYKIATELADASGGKIKVSVVEHVNSTTPILNHFFKCKKIENPNDKKH